MYSAIFSYQGVNVLQMKITYKKSVETYISNIHLCCTEGKTSHVHTVACPSTAPTATASTSEITL